jgi:alkylated DNA nucleotide flippase Atl1
MPAITDPFLDWPAPTVHVLDDAKAARLRARTMLMPSPGQIQAALATVPHGTTKTMKVLRAELAAESGAEMTCPVAATKCWRAVANHTSAPWWRITFDGKPSSRAPGGLGNHRALLAAEGVTL